MGWRGTLRSINAAGNRAKRESERREREASRALGRLERSTEEALSKVKRFESRLQSNPIGALELKYDKEAGLQSKPLDIDVGLFSGSLDLKIQGAGQSPIERLEILESPEAGLSVRPLDFLLTRWATLVPFEVSHDDPEFRPRANWVKRSDRSNSPALLLDEENSEYYYPIAADSGGEILPGHARVVLVAFEPFRRPTHSVQIRISDVKVGAARNQKGTFAFRLADAEMPGQIQAQLEAPTLLQSVEEQLRLEEAMGREAIQKQGSGCMVLLFLLSGGISGLLLTILGPMVKEVSAADHSAALGALRAPVSRKAVSREIGRERRQRRRSPHAPVEPLAQLGANRAHHLDRIEVVISSPTQVAVPYSAPTVAAARSAPAPSPLGAAAFPSPIVPKRS